MAERGIIVDRSSVYRWVIKIGPEISKRTAKHLRRASVDWHVDETTSGLAENGVIFGELLMRTARWWISASLPDGMRKRPKPFLKKRLSVSGYIDRSRS